MESFEETGIQGELLDAVKTLGFIKPTPIQAKTIPHLLSSNKDLIATAQTGTGKTAAFGLPAIQLTNLADTRPQTLVLCPTRELCLQIAKDLESYASNIRGLGIVAVYGGASIVPQIKSLARAAQIVVATPGRCKDLINRKKLQLSNVHRVVLDEADEMLSMGFKEDLDAILAETSKNKQTLLFSATMSKDIVAITNKHMADATKISVAGQNLAAENVKHLCYTVTAKDRYELLKRLADINPNIYAIVFCRTRRETKEFANKLIQDGYNADALHGDLSQAQRDEAMGRFRSRQLQILVATDVAARGLDVEDITHIINIGLPDEPEVYIHRSGRTGRAGKSGISIAITSSRDSRKIKEIEKRSGIVFDKEPVPSGKDICETQLYKLIDKIKKVVVDKKQIEPFLPTIYERLEGLDREQLIQHFVSAEFNRFLSYYKNARDLNTSGSGRDDRRAPRDKRDKRDERNKRGKRDVRDREARGDSGRRGEKGDWGEKLKKDRGRQSLTRLFINIGSKNGMNPTRLIGLINEGLDSGDAEIGKIEIMKSFSFFEIEDAMGDKLIKALKGQAHDNVPLVVETSNEKPAGSFTKKKKQGKQRDFSKGDNNNSGSYRGHRKGNEGGRGRRGPSASGQGRKSR